MKFLKVFKRVSCLFALLFCATFFIFACGNAKEVATKTEKKVAATNDNVAKDKKEIKEVKVTKLNEGGLKQELSTKATISTTNKKEVTFEVPASQLQGLKVGDAMVIKNGNKSYPAKILTLPPANKIDLGQPLTSSKVIVTASVGPGVNLPINQNGYMVTYLYNNRDPRTHYIKKEYVYYDGPRAYVNVTGPDRVIRRKYIRTGLINRYYAEILDEIDETDRIVENYINDYVNNVVPNILEDYTNQVIDDYNKYIDSLTKRWDVDEEVNTITIDVNDIDWNQLVDQDIILTDDDIIEISEEIINETHEVDYDSQNSDTIKDESLVQVDINDDGGVVGGGSFDDKSNNENDDSDGAAVGGGSFDDKSNNINDDSDGAASGGGSFDDKTNNINYDNDGGVSGGGSFDDKSSNKSDEKDDEEVVVTGNLSDDKDETTEQVTERAEIEEATTVDNDDDINDNAITSNDDDDTHSDYSNDEDSNDNSGNDTSDNDLDETTTDVSDE